MSYLVQSFNVVVVVNGGMLNAMNQREDPTVTYRWAG
jgi:hypothetical protein